MRFVVVADTHVQLEDAPVGDFPANRLLAGRNRHVVELVEEIAPAFVVHLGDVVHPVPGDPRHEAANELAAADYRRSPVPVYVVPGNHDVGDKPYGFVDAPEAAEPHYARFRARWGDPFRSFAREGCRFVLLDTPSIGSALPRAGAHMAWLEETLRAASAAGERIFLFGHYPPYLWRPDEPEHYDNLAPEGRRRLLELVAAHRVEAVFSGHVHHFFHTRYGSTDLYVVPAVGFVRPGYAEFAPVAPGGEFGRDERSKLGLFVVDVDDDGHRVLPVRTDGRVEGARSPLPVDLLVEPDWGNPLGVTMRHGWTRPRELTMDGLDAFVRKQARDDSPVLALWEARIERLRVPLGDLLDADGRRRIEELADRGMRFTVVLPGPEASAAVPSVAGVECWEVVVPPGSPAGAWRRPPAGTRLAVAPVVPFAGECPTHGHFVAAGFSPTAPLPEWVAGLDVDDVVWRVRHDEEVWAAIERVARRSDRRRGARVVVELPRLGEGRPFVDEVAVANRVVETLLAATEHREVAVFLDGWSDHDRGYFPRRGLIDRRGRPGAAHRALVAVAARCGRGTGGWSRRVDAGVRSFDDGHTTVVLVESVTTAPAPLWSPVTGAFVGRGEPLPRGPWLSPPASPGGGPR